MNVQLPLEEPSPNGSSPAASPAVTQVGGQVSTAGVGGSRGKVLSFSVCTAVSLAEKKTQTTGPRGGKEWQNQGFLHSESGKA